MNRILAVIALALLPLAVQARTLRVVGDANLEVRVTAAGTIAQVSGTLRDELQRGIAHREVHVTLSGVGNDAKITRDLLTDSRGGFAIAEEMPPGQYVADVTFESDPHLSSASATAQTTLTPSPLTLSLVGPPLAVGKGTPILIYARATAGAVPVQTDAYVSVNGEQVGTISFDSSGRGGIDLAGKLEVGSNTVNVTVPGSAYRDAVSQSLSVRWEKALEVQAEMEEGLERLSRGYIIHGTVRGSAGPVSGVRVHAIFLPVDKNADGVRQPVTAFTQTDDAGRFSGFASDVRLGGGQWSGLARVIPPVGAPIEAKIAPISVAQASGWGVVNVFGILVLVVGAGFLSLRGFATLTAKLRRWREARQRRRAQEQAFEVEERLVPIRIERHGEPAARRDVGGVLWDEWRQRPAFGCRLQARQGDDVRTAEVTSDGQFNLTNLSDGEWEISVTGPGFVRGTFVAKIPHDGRLASIRLDVVAVPLKVRRLYQAALEAVNGEDPWGRLSPREIEMELNKKLKLKVLVEQDATIVDLLAEITQAVEESYFSGRQFDETFWRQTRDLVIAWRNQGAA